MGKHLDELEKKMAEYADECDRNMQFCGVCIVAISAVVTISTLYWIFS